MDENGVDKTPKSYLVGLCVKPWPIYDCSERIRKQWIKDPSYHSQKSNSWSKIKRVNEIPLECSDSSFLLRMLKLCITMMKLNDYLIANLLPDKVGFLSGEDSPLVLNLVKLSSTIQEPNNTT